LREVAGAVVTSGGFSYEQTCEWVQYERGCGREHWEKHIDEEIFLALRHLGMLRLLRQYVRQRSVDASEAKE
jgi:hypothetical protein